MALARLTRPRSARLLGAASIVGGLLAVAVAVFGPASAASATPPSGPTSGSDQKVWVCKYVDKEGQPETLQTGNNPIDVSVSTLKGFTGTLPFQFPDAQGKSIAIAFVTDKSNPPALSECPLPTPDLTPVTVTFPQETAATCTAAGALPATPADTDAVTWSWSGLTLTATARSGYVIDGAASMTYPTPAEAIGYQSTDPNGLCYQAPVATTTPTATPSASSSVVTEVLADDSASNPPDATAVLASTGSNDIQPLLLVGLGAIALGGIVLMESRRSTRRARG